MKTETAAVRESDTEAEPPAGPDGQPGRLYTILSWILSPLYLLTFCLLLVLWHPVVMLASRIGQRSMDFTFYLVNLSLLQALRLVGTRIDFRLRDDIPSDRPLIIITNHQSHNDIQLISVAFRKHGPKFVAKTQLASWVPTVSYVLRRFGSVLIDRGNPRQALPAISRFAEFIRTNNFAAVIFPEGTRARDGRMKTFKSSGILSLAKQMPNAMIVPCAIHNSWQLMKHGGMPLPFGTSVTFQVLEPVLLENIERDKLPGLLEARIRSALASLETQGHNS